MGSVAPSLAEMDASVVKVTRRTDLRDVPLPGSPEELSHSYCTDHMVTVRWTAAAGWETPEVRPFENLSVPPTASCLHYATECFEGMKVYRGYDGKLRLFRPDCNGERLVSSAQRASLPGFKFDELKVLIAKLMQIDGPRWLPKDQPGRFLYLRPAMIGNGPHLGVQTPKEALLFIIAVPWPDPSKKKPEAAGGQHGLKLLASNPDTIRAWPGGFGYAKLGANYGPSLVSHGKAQAIGFDQVLWLFGEDRQVTEAGASNFFIVWENKDTGKLELVTAPLENQLILPGVTRRSVLELARKRLTQSSGSLAPVEVVEKQFTISDVHEAWKEGRIVEAFVCGTAVSRATPYLTQIWSCPC
ncbi:branched-chain amino acid aminotransferase II [Aspergillus heteromorphus CBS 117.55]|uniref:Branched-chain-amino-acid aminotransferase n=1 Tax=Aspergillus heteromorphus CBS 117.55 TaxID=1448321 RepID=A0A317VH38_9EURO|nr:branched-chain amino acid aminotransferase II [Aspergillus heteromorphus CBS 117.55]PWY73676.1 branched-chain amino acid aminotransferase II [Aspergillus heteromorphus CBS 117.55]